MRGAKSIVRSSPLTPALSPEGRGSRTEIVALSSNHISIAHYSLLPASISDNNVPGAIGGRPISPRLASPSTVSFVFGGGLVFDTINSQFFKQSEVLLPQQHLLPQRAVTCTCKQTWWPL